MFPGEQPTSAQQIIVYPTSFLYYILLFRILNLAQIGQISLLTATMAIFTTVTQLASQLMTHTLSFAPIMRPPAIPAVFAGSFRLLAVYFPSYKTKTSTSWKPPSPASSSDTSELSNVY